jgi:hypothetical protein
VLHAERAVEVNSADLPTRVTAPLFLYGRGDPLALLARLGEVPPPAGAPPTHYLYLAQLTACALTGDRAGVAKLLTPDVIGFLSSNLYNAFYGAEIAALAGDGRQTMAFLERAVALGLGCYPLLAAHSRPLAPFREDPAFQPVLAAVRARWEALREQGAAS